MTETKKVVCMTEWEVTLEDGRRLPVCRTTSLPRAVTDVAVEMQRPKRPEPYTHEQLYRIYMDDPGYAKGSLMVAIDADRQRQAEIAAWDAEHASDAPVWVEAPKVYPEDGWYWYRTDKWDIGLDAERAGEAVSRIVTHIAGPIQIKPPVD